MEEQMEAEVNFSQSQEMEWVRLVIKVQAKLMTATEAAEKMGVSRKTYYEKEKRALSGMLAGLERKEPGRPAAEVDPEKEALKKELEEMKEDVLLLRQELRIKEALKLVNEEMGVDKKKDRGNKAGR